jgi:5,10-methylenetetrahydromethanopterin reductase
MTLEVWTPGIPWPPRVGRAAAAIEAAGWDGFAVVDSQNLAGDPYVALALAVSETERLKLGTGVTNPVTRHPAATAAAIASVHMASGGRAVLGIGRGDSALAHLGRAPAPVSRLERYLLVLQAYLRGEEVTFDELDFALDAEAPPPVDVLGLAAGPVASRLHWLPPDLPKVPVEVAATGPRTIAVSARHADRVMLAVGADPERVRWGIDAARAARADVAIGAFVNVVAHPDVEVARRIASGGVATFARFSVMHGRVSGPAGDEDRSVLRSVHRAYDMNRHTMTGSPQAGVLTPEFVDRFAIVGPVDACVGRLADLVALGLGKLTITGPTLGADPTEARAARDRVNKEVLPELRAAVSRTV